MKRLAIIYWPAGGSVEKAASIVENNVQGFQVQRTLLSDIDIQTLLSYDSFIFGGSTVGADHWSNKESHSEWSNFFAAIEDQSGLKGKKAAVFGLGNQVIYPDHFVDDMLEIKTKLEAAGLTIVGETDTEGYDFDESKAVIDGKFVGLALDEDVQPELTEPRIKQWFSNMAELL
jgi:flavodoxin I